MKIEKLTLPDSAIDFLKSQGYEKLYPPQADCVKSGLLDGKSILVSAPTASGKTLIAMLAMLSYLSKNEGKVIYLSPLRALAAEKFTEFKKLENILIGKKIKTSISTGDFNHIEKNLENSNVLILTNEKMDSIIRHGAKWIEDIGLVISDEVHLIGDESRGPTLEMILTHLKLLNTKPQIIGLSATITNSNEIADWLGCKLVKNDWRPVPLSEGVCDGGKVTMSDGKTFEVKPSLRGIPIDLGVQSVQNGGQSLVFAETRVRSKSLATKAADVISQLLKKNELSALEKISKQLLAENEHTEIVKTLAILIKKGVAFHHAGLNQKCREIVEKEFRAGNIKLLSSTPTLAAGVNLPARRVVISNINRYNAKVGANRPISILEYKQLCGRAGRPQYDTYGESIIVGNGNTEDLIEYYIHGEPEPIVSKITEDKSLRTHILSVIVTHPGIKKEELVEFFLQTLGGLQTTKDTLIFAINISLRFLLTQQLIIKKSERYEGTAFGKKTSMLYIDPLTATYFRDAIDNVSEKRKHTFGFLHLMTNCEEFFPKFLLRNKDYEPTSLMIENHSSELIGPISEYDCSRSLLALQMWITESSELALSDTLGIEAGDMHRMVENANWLSYCLWEISKHIERTDLLEEFSDLRKRVVYGIRAELLDLVRVKGIGRIRARVLFKNNIKNLDDLAKIPVNKLADIDKIGLTIANNIKDELKKVRY
ncbi:MAG: DEAD/DEAH box helicase [Crenarchaeota archaeon]|nr:DEAD/DEAH box helicase [Thermoproteota archaeon]HJJ20896.1 DEAD/DEAH box helicase [Nitrosopumilus sp.]MDA0853700.1 DEAD/DEAH box helicase [Thermoproteota archaeon]MDA1122695.1 DEAD/DEAH box helicase [Thermoproteota archaeon]HJJ24043.1 DEAD/DEAH box helicase [Nitrosopumilus sp.]